MSDRSPAIGSLHPAVIVHGLEHARLTLSFGRPVTLLSAPGAALYAGCGWWRALVDRARSEFPGVSINDVLDCGDGAGAALAALRVGQRLLVLSRDAPGWDAVAAAAAEQGSEVMPVPPPALDLAAHDAVRRLSAWLPARSAVGDNPPPLR